MLVLLLLLSQVLMLLPVVAVILLLTVIPILSAIKGSAEAETHTEVAPVQALYRDYKNTSC
jgi:hypothetical protein